MVSPANNSIISNPPVLIEWDSLPSSAYYKVEIATDINFTSIISTTITTATSFTFNPTITNTTKCYIRLKSNLTNWSPTYNFTFFKPSDLDSLMIWYKADEGVTQTGTSVSNWKDFSPFSFDAKQATVAYQPQLVNNITLLNNKPVIRLDGVDDNLVNNVVDNVCNFGSDFLPRNRSIYIVSKFSGAIVPGSPNYVSILGSCSFSNFHGSNDSVLLVRDFMGPGAAYMVADGNVYLNTASILSSKIQKPFKYSIISFFLQATLLLIISEVIVILLADTGMEIMQKLSVSETIIMAPEGI